MLPNPLCDLDRRHRRLTHRCGNMFSCHMSPPPPVPPTCLEIADRPLQHTTQESRQGYRPAAPIQQFNNKSLNWPSWFCHFKAVADVHGWDKDQRALQLVSYLDETAMYVAQELADDEFYNYDVLVKLLSDRFDPASRVSASRSRFHGRLRRHHEDVDAYADSITELCRIGYPQSSPELRQELISEQFVRGQSDPELKKYLWVVIRTQKERKLQTLIEVCLRQPRSGHEYLSTGGAGIRVGGGRRARGYGRHDRSFTVDRSGRVGAYYAPFLTTCTDVYTCSPDGLWDASDRSSCGDRSTGAGFPTNTRTGIPNTIPTGTRLLRG